MKLKTIICGFAVAVLAASCMKGGSYKADYTDYCSFESGYISEYTKDSLYFKSDFLQSTSWQTLLCCGKRNNAMSGEEITDVNDFKGGLMLSMLKDTLVEPGHIDANSFKSRYSTVADTTGADKSKGFAILHYVQGGMPDHTIVFIQSAYGSCVPMYMKVCNTNYVVNVMSYGYNENRSGAFQEGDYLKLVVTAIINDVATKSVEKMMGEFKDGKLTYVSGWEKFDLSELGDFDYLDLKMETNNYAVPTDCCIDGLVMNVSISR